jgi:DNA-binding MurR/RpiR family transcriptional regulator
MNKENLSLGKIAGLTGSEKKVLETLLKHEKELYSLSVKQLRLTTGLSESSITKATCFLKERGIITGSHGSVKINGKVLVKKLQEEE